MAIFADLQTLQQHTGHILGPSTPVLPAGLQKHWKTHWSASRSLGFLAAAEQYCSLPALPWILRWFGFCCGGSRPARPERRRLLVPQRAARAGGGTLPHPSAVPEERGVTWAGSGAGAGPAASGKINRQGGLRVPPNAN